MKFFPEKPDPRHFESGDGANSRRIAAAFLRLFAGALAMSSLASFSFGQAAPELEGRSVERIDIAFEGADRDVGSFEYFHSIASGEIDRSYSIVSIRRALQALYDTNRIVSAKVEAEDIGSAVVLRFVIKRKARASSVTVNILPYSGEEVTEQELLLRLNLLTPGSEVSERILEQNANVVLAYLRDRGYQEAEVDHVQTSPRNDSEVAVTFEVSPGTQAKVREFNIAIDKFDDTEVRPELALQPGNPFSRNALIEDVLRITNALQEQGYLAPTVNEPRVVYDGESNTMAIEFTGEPGALVNIDIDAEEKEVSTRTRDRLVPIRRDATLDYSAIIEGQRRLENYFQEQGFFFTRVYPTCSVTPELSEDEAGEATNGTELLCTALSGANLRDRTVTINYETDLNRRYKLVRIELEGTDKITIDDVKPVLESQEANILGVIPYLGYGNGLTSLDLLQRDRDTIASVMQRLGYRRARVGVSRSVSLDGEDLIVTFTVNEGIPTRIVSVEFEGNTRFDTERLRKELPEMEGKNFSFALARNGENRIKALYANEGYFEADVGTSVDEPVKAASGEYEEVAVKYTIDDKEPRAVVKRILVSGNASTNEDAILKAIDIRTGEYLTRSDIFSSEQNLFATDAFDNVKIEQEPAAMADDNDSREYDVLVNLEEKKPRLLTYGGGFSTDYGLSGFFDIRHFNLFGRLHQGGIQVRLSQRQQLFQFDYVNPWFVPDGRDERGNRRYAPLTFSAQYQRDSTVTRFFRSTFDRGTFGIVQRIDENGVPIDEFGASAGDPTINRFILSAETSRTISVRDRSAVFIKYRFEDVRLFDFGSLLIRELLEPDAKIRISGINASFVRDTRKNCSERNSILELIERGVPGERCRPATSDATDGDVLTAEYRFSTPALGANVGFNRFQFSYNRYHTIEPLLGTTFAARVVFGAANIFSGGDRFSNTSYPGLNGSLPISERFFAGGSTSIRGFDFEEAGPRVVVAPEGTFRNQQGEIVTLSPFTIPFGGNALAIVNLEARIPVTDSVRIVPFYDGGNVFSRTEDIFNPPDAIPGDSFSFNSRAVWTDTLGLGLRFKTPIGGEFAVDYGYLIRPPEFLIPQPVPPDGIYRLRQGQLHFRFSQAF